MSGHDEVLPAPSAASRTAQSCSPASSHLPPQATATPAPPPPAGDYSPSCPVPPSSSPISGAGSHTTANTSPPRRRPFDRRHRGVIRRSDESCRAARDVQQRRTTPCVEAGPGGVGLKEGQKNTTADACGAASTSPASAPDSLAASAALPLEAASPKFEAYNSKGEVVSGDKSKEVVDIWRSRSTVLAVGNTSSNGIP